MSQNTNFTFFTDSTCDLPTDILDKNNVICLNLTYEVDGIEYNANNLLSIQDFYTKMRAGSTTKTSQIAPDTFINTFKNELENGRDILYISFSSGLSGTYNSARIASETLKEAYPDAKIYIVDSLCASLGEGLLVYKAIQLMNAGKSIDEIANWLEENKLHLCHMFTVDDLMFLHRGGRVSKTSAIAGSILGIKPGLHVDNDGHLIPISKIRGRKQSLNWLVSNMADRIGNWENDTIAICHGDCIDDANYVADLAKSKFGVKNVIINHTGPVIGSHSGPGTLALFFMGDYR